MYNIHYLNKISPKGTEQWTEDYHLCDNAADADAVKAILQSRIDSQISNQMNYPMVIEGWQNNARIVSNGNFIMLAVGTDCDAFVDGFNALF